MNNTDTLLQFTIPIQPITKKNSQQIIYNPKLKRSMIIPSKAYKQYEKDCKHFMKRLEEPINEPVNVQAIYYMGTRRKVDLTNLHEALHDTLVTYRVLEDDNCKIIVSTDGSRVEYDKENPRTEIIITKAKE